MEVFSNATSIFHFSFFSRWIADLALVDFPLDSIFSTTHLLAIGFVGLFHYSFSSIELSSNPSPSHSASAIYKSSLHQSSSFKKFSSLPYSFIYIQRHLNQPRVNYNNAAFLHVTASFLLICHKSKKRLGISCVWISCTSILRDRAYEAHPAPSHYKLRGAGASLFAHFYLYPTATLWL